jgi:hypothetical protein
MWSISIVRPAPLASKQQIVPSQVWSTKKNALEIGPGVSPVVVSNDGPIFVWTGPFLGGPVVVSRDQEIPMSVPYRGKVFTFQQPDGKELQVRGWGDQSYAVFETLDGYSVVRDPSTGYYQYATLSPDATELRPVGAIAGRVDAAALGLLKGVRVKREAARAMAVAGRSGGERKRRWEERREQRLMQVRAANAGAIALAPPSHASTGDVRGCAC